MAQKLTKKEESVESFVIMKAVFEYFEKKHLNAIDWDELTKEFGLAAINKLHRDEILYIDCIDGKNRATLSPTGLNLRSQQKINENLDNLNASVTKLNKSSDELNLLTLYLIALTAILIIKEYQSNSVYLIILVLILPVISWIINKKHRCEKYK